MTGMEIIEEEEYSEDEEGQVSEVSCTVNDHVTLHQPELCAIYTAIHWACKPDGSPWSDVEIKEIVGHAILRLAEDEYRHLDLRDVIGWLQREDNDLTRAVKPVAERLKGDLVPWIARLREKYLHMCGMDAKSVSPLRSVMILELTWCLGRPNSGSRGCVCSVVILEMT